MMKTQVRFALLKKFTVLAKIKDSIGQSVWLQVPVAPLTNCGPQASDLKRGPPIFKTKVETRSVKWE